MSIKFQQLRRIFLFFRKYSGICRVLIKSAAWSATTIEGGLTAW
jgi:hypothetical protein